MSKAVAYERVRASTVKGTWILPLVGAVLAWALVLTRVLVDDAPEHTLGSLVVSGFTILSIVFITAPCAQAFGHDYRDGTIRLTLTLFPRRSDLFTARLAVPAVVAALGAAVTVVGIAAISQIEGTSLGSLGPLVGRAVVYVVLYGLLVAAVTTLVRRTSAGIMAVLLWTLVVENLIVGLVGTRVPVVADLLPVSQGEAWLEDGSLVGLGVMAAAVAVLLALAGVAFVRRDA